MTPTQIMTIAKKLGIPMANGLAEFDRLTREECLLLAQNLISLSMEKGKE